MALRPTGGNRWSVSPTAPVAVGGAVPSLAGHVSGGLGADRDRLANVVQTIDFTKIATIAK